MRLLRNRSTTVPVLLAVALSLPLASCGRGADQRQLVVGFEGHPLSLDPHHKNEAVTWSVLSNFYDGLVRFSAELKLEPALAESWEQLDATHWKFHLRKNVRFRRGEPFSAADVVASFERARSDPQSGIRHHLLGVTRMTAVDALTLVVETDGPSPTLLNRLVFLPVVAASDAKLREITEPNGTGPYRLVRHDDPDSLLLEGWAGWRGMPEIRRVKFVFATDGHALFQRFLAGEIDVLRQVPEDRLGDLRDSTHVRAEPQPRLAINMIAVSAAGGQTGGPGRCPTSGCVARSCSRATVRGGWARSIGETQSSRRSTCTLWSSATTRGPRHSRTIPRRRVSCWPRLVFPTVSI
jgi:peptide/nickel transport system substrate-binding protein